MDIVLKVVVFLLFYIHAVTCQMESKNKGVVLEDGASLSRLGQLYNNPLFRMLGKVFTNTEGLVVKAKEEIFEDLCDLHPCSVWSPWTYCTALEADSYGIQTRNRTCGVDSPFCIQPKGHGVEKPSIENDYRICEGKCPSQYTHTRHGFCLKLFKDKLTRSEADKKCQADGAFVINIDSEVKSNDLHDVLANASVTSEDIWIDGRRSSVSSPWTFLYGITPVWTNWKSGEPSNGGTELCRIEEDSVRKWYDRGCSGPYWFVCEIPQSVI